MSVEIKLRSEHDEQVALFAWHRLYVKQFPALDWMFAIPNAARRSPGVAAYMRAEGLTAGVFDVFVPFPIDPYHGLFIEMKRPPNTLTSLQTMFGQTMARRGYLALVCYTAEDAVSAICHYLGLPRGCLL